MKKLIIICLLLPCYFRSAAQQVVVDVQHLVAVNQNAVVRNAAETTHDQYLGRIKSSIDALNTNTASVVAAQTIIYEGLSNVNSALKNGLAVKNMAVIIADMTGYISEALKLAQSDPYLLVFAERIAADMRTRSLMLLNDVSGYILKDGGGVLADYNARDQLLRKVTRQLQILDGLAYGTWKAMYWARQRGIIASMTPFAGYVNRDRDYVEQIIRNARYLKP